MKFLFASLFVVISAGVASADWKAYKVNYDIVVRVQALT